MSTFSYFLNPSLASIPSRGSTVGKMPWLKNIFSESDIMKMRTIAAARSLALASGAATTAFAQE